VAGVNATIGIRSSNGVQFGTLRGYRDGVFRFHCDDRLVVDEKVELRMELPGAGATIYGAVLIERVREGRAGGPPGYVARVVEMSVRDRDALTAWIEDLSGGGTSKTPDRTLSMSDHIGALRSLPPSEVKRALRSFDRRAGREDISGAWGIGGERRDTSAITGAGRAAIRSALAGVLTEAATEQDGRGGDVSGPARPDWLVPEAVSEAPDPDFAFDAEVLSVTFRSSDVAAAQYASHIRGGGLLVPGTQWSWPVGTRFAIRLHLPNAVVVRCPAEVVAVMPSGFGLSLKISNTDQDRLRALYEG